MEPADLGVILDSSILIEAERNHFDVATFLKLVMERLGEREVALSAITVAELAHGIYRAVTPERRDIRRTFLDDLKHSVAIYPVTVDTAEIVGRLHAETAAHGVIVPFDDLLIGSCAVERGYAIVTRNGRHFARIPGLKLIPF